METFTDYLEGIDNPQHRVRTEEILNWVTHTFPNLSQRIAWNQPTFVDHGTFIIGFSLSKQHIAVSPEKAGILRFADEIVKSGYEPSKMLFRIKWGSPVDFSLLERIIAYNILDKADCKTFWRK